VRHRRHCGFGNQLRDHRGRAGFRLDDLLPDIVGENPRNGVSDFPLERFGY
jgi:hypothetical protein